MKRAFLAALFAIALVPLTLAAALAHDTSKPMLLVASLDLKGPYAGTVVHAIPFHGGHIGLILNRQSTALMGNVFHDHPASKAIVEPIFIGGYEFTDVVFAVARFSRARDPSSIGLMPGVWLERSVKIIDTIIEKTPNEARYFVGLVAWKPGLLDQEILQGFWEVRRPDAAVFFFKDPPALYQKLRPRAKGEVES